MNYLLNVVFYIIDRQTPALSNNCFVKVGLLRPIEKHI